MMSAIHNPPDAMKQVLAWYAKSHIDYTGYYIALYAAYNAWYREVTSTSNDRVALGSLKKRFVIWDDYCNGVTLQSLRPYMVRLSELTQREPLSSMSLHWNGEIAHVTDWQSLIEYWYQVRCLVVHGAQIHAKYVWLAYETLDIFMNEIIARTEACLNSPTVKAIGELSKAIRVKGVDNTSERVAHLQQKLYQKYVAMPNIWQVDMQRVDGSS